MSAPMPGLGDRFRGSRFSWILFFTLLLVFLKLFLTFKIPVLADEAYYVFWGTHPAGGYYDLPPMIGWWESFFARFSLHPFWVRIPNVLVTALVSFGIYDLLRNFGKNRAKWVATIYFVLPIHLLGVMVSPDVPLIFFSFFSALLYFHADRKMMIASSRPSGSSLKWEALIGYFCSGVLWGAAFLSKYFAVMMFPGVLVWLILSRKSWRERLFASRGLLLVILGALPFLFQHLWWNSQNCWANFIFNLVTRQKVIDGTIYQTFGTYLLYLALLITPVFLLDVFKSGRTELHVDGHERDFGEIEQEKLLRQFSLCMWGVPIGLFGLTALMSKGQGIHWYLSYMPFFVMWIGLKLNFTQIRSRLIALMVISGILGVMACTAVSAPRWVIAHLLHHRFQLDLEISLSGEELAQKIAPWVRQSQAVMTDGYVYTSALDNELRKYGVLDPHDSKRSVGMWGGGSRFGRVLDWTTDFSKLDGQSILLFSGAVTSSAEFAKYFDHVTIQKENLYGAEFYLTLGVGFKAHRYVEQVVAPSMREYYPDWIFRSKCPLKNTLHFSTGGEF